MALCRYYVAGIIEQSCIPGKRGYSRKRRCNGFGKMAMKTVQLRFQNKIILKILINVQYSTSLKLGVFKPLDFYIPSWIGKNNHSAQPSCIHMIASSKIHILRLLQGRHWQSTTPIPAISAPSWLSASFGILFLLGV